MRRMDEMKTRCTVAYCSGEFLSGLHSLIFTNPRSSYLDRIDWKNTHSNKRQGNFSVGGNGMRRRRRRRRRRGNTGEIIAEKNHPAWIYSYKFRNGRDFGSSARRTAGSPRTAAITSHASLDA